jgi:hypothetical protein
MMYELAMWSRHYLINNGDEQSLSCTAWTQIGIPRLNQWAQTILLVTFNHDIPMACEFRYGLVIPWNSCRARCTMSMPTSTMDIAVMRAAEAACSHEVVDWWYAVCSLRRMSRPTPRRVHGAAASWPGHHLLAIAASGTWRSSGADQDALPLRRRAPARQRCVLCGRSSDQRHLLNAASTSQLQIRSAAWMP